MLYSVGYDQICGVEIHIVSCNLIKCILTDLYLRGFTFYNDKWRACLVKNQNIGSFNQIIDLALLFKCDQRKGVFLIFMQVGNKILSHPFFLRKQQVFFSNLIKNIKLIFSIFDAKGILWKVEICHPTKIRNFL